MLETKTKANLFDVVEVVEDLPEYGVKCGERGTVVEVLDDPSEAYILEFVGENGSSRLAYWVRPEQIFNLYDVAREAFAYGIELLNKGRHAQAISEFRKAVKIRPDCVGVLHNSFVQSFEGADDWQRMITAMRLVLRVEPGYQIGRDNLATAFLNHGVEKAAEGDLDSSRNLYHVALGIGASPAIVADLHRNLAAAYTGLGLRAHESGQLEQALNDMGRACAFHPTPQTRRNLSLAYAYLGFSMMDLGRLGDAIDYFEMAQDAGLATPRLLNDYGVALAHRGRTDEAVLAFEMALEIEPDSQTVQQNLRTIREHSSKAATGEILVVPYPVAEESPVTFLPPPNMVDRRYIPA